MGNVIGDILSSVVQSVGNFLGAPLDFLTGKSCSSVCDPTWDLFCYIENFCVANLLRLVAVSILFYLVLLFFYILYKVGICGCISRGLCKMTCSSIMSCFSMCEYGCLFSRYKLKNMKRIYRGRRQQDMEEYGSSFSEVDLEASMSFRRHPRESSDLSRRRRRSFGECRRMYFDRSLRPRSHQVRVGISRGSVSMRGGDSLNNIKVTRTTRFVRKSYVDDRRRRRRW